MKRNKNKKKCGFCEMRKKMKNSKGKPVKESYAREGDLQNYIQELKFAASKPFKLNFSEGFSITWKNATDLQEKAEKAQMTKKQKEKKEEIASSAKEKGAFKKYGKRADEVRSRTATKLAMGKKKK